MITLNRLQFAGDLGLHILDNRAHRPSYRAEHVIPQPGDQLSWSELAPIDREVWSSSEGDLFVLTCTSWSEDSRSAVERSNYEALQAAFPETFVLVGDERNGAALALSAYRGLDPMLVRALEGLADYPLFDEEHYSTLVEENFTSSWDSYRSYDLSSELVDVHGYDELDRVLEETDCTDAVLRMIYVSIMWEWSISPEEETATDSTVNRHDHERIVTEMVRRLDGWILVAHGYGPTDGQQLLSF